MQQKNFLLFVIVTFLLFIGWMYVSQRIWPPPVKKPAEETVAKEPPVKVNRPGVQAALGPMADWTAKAPPKPPRKVVGLVRHTVTPADKLHTLGDDDLQSPYHLRVKLDPRGASVRSVLLKRFQSIDGNGKPVLEDGKEAPLELVPDEANQTNPSFLLNHYDPAKPSDDRPLDTLSRRVWTLEPGADAEHASFQTELTDLGLAVTKTYTLAPHEYHVGLEVKVHRKANAVGGDLNFRYQLTGAHGLPIEGEWYTSVFRNVLIARDNKGSIDRRLDDMRQMIHLAGGEAVNRDGNNLIRYAGVAVQYFASVVVVDNNQTNQDFLARARPSLETTVTKGVVKSIDEENRSFVLGVGGGKEMTFFVLPGDPLPPLEGPRKEPIHLAVVHYADSELRQIAVRLASEARTQPLWIDDVTVRVATEPEKLRPNDTIVHKYLLYNGPVKPSLLRQQSGEKAVPAEVVDRYVYTLHLNTLTDYRSQGWPGTIASTIGFTWLVIQFTNLMHWVLGGLHVVVASYGLCIILLTVMVRGMMFPLSRKQALTSIRMQALAPELKKLGEEYKDDPQGKAMAQMKLYRKHGVNIYGSCWMLFLQMPVFMGLYFALQESIYFRGASFWPTWIINLAAPDMLFSWGESIPWISRPEDYGGFLYLGPYLNLLPVIAVTLMIGQQKLMTPPPTDEQQEMQQKMMKYMMIFMGLFFYKVAAGLCIYFIASSVWGFTERRLLPKLKPKVVSADEMMNEMVQRPAAATPGGSTAVTPSVSGRSSAVTEDRGRRGKPGRVKKKERAGQAGARDGEESKSAIGRLRQRLSNWWAEVLRQAENRRQAERKK